MASLLDELKNEDMSRILDICEKQKFADGDTIFTQGDIAWDMYLIRKGKISLKADIEEIGSVKLGTELPGSFVGEVAMINDVPREFTAIAVGEVEVFKITKRDLDSLQRMNLALTTRFYLTIIRDLNKKLKKLNKYYQEVRNRISSKI